MVEKVEAPAPKKSRVMTFVTLAVIGMIALFGYNAHKSAQKMDELSLYTEQGEPLPPTYVRVDETLTAALAAEKQLVDSGLTEKKYVHLDDRQLLVMKKTYEGVIKTFSKDGRHQLAPTAAKEIAAAQAKLDAVLRLTKNAAEGKAAGKEPHAVVLPVKKQEVPDRTQGPK